MCCQSSKKSTNLKGIVGIEPETLTLYLKTKVGEAFAVASDGLDLNKGAHAANGKDSLNEKTLRRMITNRQLKAKRIGGSIRIPHEELAKIVREY